MSIKKFPPGWDKSRVKKVLSHYEQQTEEEAVAEDEAARELPGQTFIEVPSAIVPQVRRLIAEQESRDKSSS